MARLNTLSTAGTKNKRDTISGFFSPLSSVKLRKTNIFLWFWVKRPLPWNLRRILKHRTSSTWEHTVWALESNYHASGVKDSKIYLPFKPDPLSSCSFLEQQTGVASCRGKKGTLKVYSQWRWCHCIMHWRLFGSQQSPAEALGNMFCIVCIM